MFIRTECNVYTDRMYCLYGQNAMFIRTECNAYTDRM